MTQLTYEMFHIIEDFIEKILNSSWMSEKSQLCLIGGVMINCDNDACDMFMPLKFEVRAKDGVSIDYLTEVFPDSQQANKFM